MTRGFARGLGKWRWAVAGLVGGLALCGLGSLQAHSPVTNATAMATVAPMTMVPMAPASAPLAAVLPEATEAALTTPAETEYDTLDMDWRDATRDREVPVRLYLPKLPEGAAPMPVVVFSHGLGGSREGYSYIGRNLASHGVASLHVQHVGSDRSLWTGNRLVLVFRLQAAAQESEATARVQDLRFALDQLLAAPQWAGKLDANRIVAAGHSYGANTAMLAAGAQVWRGGKALALRDERIKAVLLLSAPPFYGEGDPGAIIGHMAVPSLHITTTEDEIQVPGYGSPPSDRLAIYEAMGSPHKALAVFQNGSHSIFTDRIVPGGVELNAQVKQATKDLVLDYVQGVFAGRPAALGGWQRRYQPMLARFEQR